MFERQRLKNNQELGGSRGPYNKRSPSRAGKDPIPSKKNWRDSQYHAAFMKKANHRKSERSRPRKHKGGFQKFARTSARWTGRPMAFGIAALFILAWLITGPIFHFSDTWQLVVNTATTIVTFLMVFLIQNTQNRDSEAVQLKLDELLRSTTGAHNALLEIEELSENELDEIKDCYTKIAKRALEDLRSGKSDLGTPDVKRKRAES
jgi:low affinity Fe/Cu permease